MTGMTPKDDVTVCGEAEGEAEGEAAMLSRVNGYLGAAFDSLEEVPLGTFADEEDYWQAKTLIAQAGQIVACNERLAAGWPTEFARVLWQLSGREEEEVSGLAARLAKLVGREEEAAPLEARLRSASAQPLDSILLADLTEALDLKDSEMHRLAMAYTYERHEWEL